MIEGNNINNHKKKNKKNNNNVLGEVSRCEFGGGGGGLEEVEEEDGDFCLCGAESMRSALKFAFLHVTDTILVTFSVSFGSLSFFYFFPLFWGFL